MGKYNLEQYKKMANNFNKLSFKEQIKTVMENSDILTLAADGNWWGVKVNDKEIQDILDDDGHIFSIENEWGSKEICTLIELLGLNITDI